MQITLISLITLNSDFLKNISFKNGGKLVLIKCAFNVIESCIPDHVLLIYYTCCEKS